MVKHLAVAFFSYTSYRSCRVSTILQYMIKNHAIDEIKGLLEMGTITNWGLLVKMVLIR